MKYTSDIFETTNTDPATIHAMCEDRRASASIDLKIDEADIKAGQKIQCPLLTLWAATGAMGKLYDMLGIWKEEKVNVFGKGLPGNHSLQESAPEETLAELQNFPVRIEVADDDRREIDRCAKSAVSAESFAATIACRLGSHAD